MVEDCGACRAIWGARAPRLSVHRVAHPSACGDIIDTCMCMYVSYGRGTNRLSLQVQASLRLYSVASPPSSYTGTLPRHQRGVAGRRSFRFQPRPLSIGNCPLLSTYVARIQEKNVTSGRIGIAPPEGGMRGDNDKEAQRARLGSGLDHSPPPPPATVLAFSPTSYLGRCRTGRLERGGGGGTGFSFESASSGSPG